LVASAEKIHDAMLLAAFLFAASLRTTCRLAATVAVTGIASWFAATVTVTGIASWFAATLAVASITSWFAATVTGIASWLAAALFAVLALAMSKQALQPAEQIMLLAMLLATSFGTAGRLAAAVTGVASWLAATLTIASITGWFAATVAVAGTASWFTGIRAATISGTAIGLTTRGRTLISEHPIEDLKTEGLTTNGHANNQRAEEQHTLHRATSPLLVDHARAFVAIATFDTPRL